MNARWIAPVAAWLPLMSRIAAALFGGYALAALCSVAALALPIDPQQAVFTGMLASFLLYAGAVIWVKPGCGRLSGPTGLNRPLLRRLAVMTRATSRPSAPVPASLAGVARSRSVAKAGMAMPMSCHALSSVTVKEMPSSACACEASVAARSTGRM